MTPTVWTTQRKWMGNLIPAVVWIVPTALGIRQILLSHRLTGVGLWLLVLADVLGLIALNSFGLYQNARMKRRLLAMLGKSGKLADDRIFVGFSTPRYAGVLDAHEDVGFLCFAEDAVVFVSETRRLELKRDEIKRICYRPNVHSLVGLGRWISLEGERANLPVRMLIEPRERNTMAGNLFYGKVAMKRLSKWLNQ